MKGYMHMKIINLGIANFKSFDSEGIILENLSKINIFIGKNNSGKSNILKFLYLCSKAIQKENEITNRYSLLTREFNKPENYFNGNKKNPEITISISHKDFTKELQEYTNTDDLLTVKIDLLTGKIIENCNILENLNEKQLYSLQNTFSRASKEDLLKVINEDIAERILNVFFSWVKKMTYIPDFRQITEQEKDLETNIENGQNIISEISKMQSPELWKFEKKEMFLKIKDFLLKELLEESNANIEVPHDKKNIIVNLYGTSFPLESFGTGIHELIIICKVLALSEKSIVCIEEPEIHLHPHLQRKFINLLLNKTNNIYFITTHSNVFLDFNQDISIYHVTYNRSKTSVSRVNTNEKCCSILEDLGYKASDLLQTNGIIWVEGPSDRIFLKKWFELLRKDFIEGIHYTIMFYGGRLLNHVSMKYQFLTDEFISLLRINKNAMIIIDSDKISPKAQLNETKERIENETKKGNCWITKGREIENYLTENTMNKWLKGECSDIPESEIIFKEGKNDKLEELIAYSNKKIKIKYNLKKVKYAKGIIEYIDDKELNILDLKERLNFLIKNIEKWNYIGQEIINKEGMPGQ
jgi:predicted ATP-dependent endonuclease of OLD family